MGAGTKQKAYEMIGSVLGGLRWDEDEEEAVAPTGWRLGSRGRTGGADKGAGW